MNRTSETPASLAASINGQPLDVEPGTTILDASRALGLSIPTLCSLPGLPSSGSCRLCLVEVKGEHRLRAACSYPIERPVDIYTHSPRVLASRRMTMELLLTRLMHNTEPQTGDERFFRLAGELGVRHSRFSSGMTPEETDDSSPAIRYNPNACIQCGLCVAACGSMQQTYAINFEGAGMDQKVSPGSGRALAETECTACGQCTVVCPTGAFAEQDHMADVLSALGDPEKIVMALLSPSVAPTIAPEFDLPVDMDVTGKLVHGLKQIGFNYVFSAGTGHDLTALETAFELRRRMETDGHLPLILSTCPSLVKQIEHQFPDLLPFLSVNRSPAQMFGRLLKSYYAQALGLSPESLVVVQITPCLASKYERQREELEGVDLTITSREVTRLLRVASGYPLTSFSDMPFDTPFHEVSGAAILSEVSGGTLEAVLRTYCELKTGVELQTVEFESLRGLAPLREAQVAVGAESIQVAVVSGLGHAGGLLEAIREGRSTHQIVEIMACPGGCVGGGGQPGFATPEIIGPLAEALYQGDRAQAVRKPRKNPALNKLYADFLKAPMGEVSEQLLQTTYSARGRY